MSLRKVMRKRKHYVIILLKKLFRKQWMFTCWKLTFSSLTF